MTCMSGMTWYPSMRGMKDVVGGLSIVALLWTTPASAGWVIDQVSQSGADTEQQQMLFQDNKMKILTFGTNGAPQDAVIFDVTAQTMTRVDYKRKQITVGSAKDLKKMMAGAQNVMAEAMKKMQTQMQNMPPEQRKMMEQMLKDRMPAATTAQPDCPESSQPEIRATGQEARIAGYATDKYDILQDGKVKSQIWIAEAISIRDDFDVEKMQQLAEAMASASPCHARSGQTGQSGFTGRGMWQLTQKGFPARIIDKKNGSEVKITKAENRTVTAQEIGYPAGFQVESMKNMMQREGLPQ